MSFSEILSIALQKSKNRDFVISVIQVSFKVSYAFNTSRILFCGYTRGLVADVMAVTTQRTSYRICETRRRGSGYSLRWPAASDQSSLTPTATYYVESHDLPWPIRGQYSDQSEASIPANQRLKDVTKRADGGKLLCIKKRVLMELLFLSKYNFDHCIFCDLNKCSRVY